MLQLQEVSEAMSGNTAVPWGDPKRLLKRTGGAFALANTRHYDSHPTDPENDTDIDQCVQRLLDNDPSLKEINMNNMKILMPVLEINTGLKKLNLETNYLSGDFFIKFFQAALTNQTLEEVRAVNQGTSYTNLEEKEIVDGIVANTGLTKVSINLRLQEDRQAVEKAMLRNGDLKRQRRRLEALEKKSSASSRN
ncbi:hypothetical protein TELCIR_00894 [Teladorsagia circumcincta]|uniref:Tropomodulin n=1 Tax=Teladorsagia circumcincta TaxID=45464 RepID=A0A2G9V3C6_TELCI|nr:hypothetical protein TELCIR_00894 [Teladorsagia circumcincta]